MIPSTRRRAICTLPLLLALGSQSAPSIAASCETPARLRFSVIPRGDVKQELAALQPLLDTLQQKLGIPVEAYVAPSYGAVVEALASGAVQLARLGPASYVSARRADPRLTPFASYANKASRFQPAGPFYHALLIVRSDSGIANIEALRGKRLALVDPESTSGALIPRHVFGKRLGRKLESWFAQVGYSGGHSASLDKLLARQIDAAFVSSQNLADEIARNSGKAAHIRVIWRSDAIPGAPFVMRGQLCEGVKDKIRDAFFNRGGRQSAAVLDSLNVARFVPVSDRDYEIVRAIY